MKDGQYDAVVLAKAGLNRLGITEENTGITIMSLPDSFVPAPAQGILAAGDPQGRRETLELLAKASDPEAHLQMRAERRFLEVLEAVISRSAPTPILKAPGSGSPGSSATKTAMRSPELADLRRDAGSGKRWLISSRTIILRNTGLRRAGS